MDEKKTHCGGLRIFGAVIVGITASSVWSLIVGGLVMVLWNWLMPMIFGLGAVTYWQAFGLALLARLMLGPPGRPFMPMAHGRKWADKRWREHIKKKGMFYKDWYSEEAYEQWWENEGSKSFEDYMKSRAAEKDENKKTS